jgi:hypothetical protein
MAASKRRDLTNLLAGQTDRHGDRSFWHGIGRASGQGLVPNLAESRLKQITAQATSTNATTAPSPGPIAPGAA